MEPDDDDHQQQTQDEGDGVVIEEEEEGQPNDLNADENEEDQQLHHDVAMNDVYEETFDPDDEGNMLDDSDIAANLLVSTSSHIY